MRQTPSLLIGAAAGLTIILSGAIPGHAAILLNFTNTHHVTGADQYADISPGQQIGGITGSHWNLINGDVSSIVDDNGNLLPGVSVDVGAASSGTTIDYGITPTFSNLGSVYNAGIFSGNVRSGMFTSSKEDRKVGVRVTGLPAGIYNVYVTAQNTNTDNINRYNIYAGTVDAASGNTDFSGLSFENLDFYNATTPKITDSWVKHVNYVMMEVTLGVGEDLVVVSDGLTSGEDRGFLNTVEIALVPEPATLSLLGLGSLTLLRRRRA